MAIDSYSTDERINGDLDVHIEETIKDQEIDSTIKTVEKGVETKHSESLEEAMGNEEKDDKKAPETEEKEEPKEDEHEESEDEDKPSRRRPSVEKRIQQLVQQRDHYRRLAEGKTVEEAKKPDVKDYKDLTEYVEAMAEYKASQLVNKVSTKEAEEEAKEEFAALEETYNEKLQKYVKENKIDTEKFKSEVNNLPFNGHMIRAVLGSENSPNVVDYLRHNPSVAKMIAKLDPIDAAREIGRIDMKFEKKSGAQVSKAPEPVKGIKKAVAPVEKDPSKMSQREYEEWRAKNKKSDGWG